MDCSFFLPFCLNGKKSHQTKHTPEGREEMATSHASTSAEEAAPLLLDSSFTSANNAFRRDESGLETSSSSASSSCKRYGILAAAGLGALFVLSSSKTNSGVTLTTTRGGGRPEHVASVKLGSFETGYDLDANAFDGDVWHVPFEFYRDTKWAQAKFWRPGSNADLDGDVTMLSEEEKMHPDEKKYMPVFKSKGVDSSPVVVTAHATNLKSNGWVILDSAKKNGLEIVISGNGTTFHGFADKMMGLKAALHSIPGNPIIVNADATDVLLQCGPEEFQKRFEQADADFIFGGETQLWPEIRKYFDMEDEQQFKREMSLTFGEIGKAAGDDVELTGEHPNVWANAGSFMGRKEELIKYIEATENRMMRHNDWKEEDGFGMTCKPAATTDEEFNNVFPGMRQFDDQECLTAFQMQKLIERSQRHKLDADGSILFSAGGAPMSQLGQDANGMVYNKQTGKASCLWHFNNPSAKIRLKDFANAYPTKFLTEVGRGAMLRTPDEHPGNRNGEVGPAPSESP
tara:strand:+ start:277 stop:1821 length:1545 start_codon:yes stop_codon:yes gene_type:complete